MLDFDREELCYGCEACYNKCPSAAITMLEGRDGFFYPAINNEKCINCRQCDKVCPVLSRSKSELTLVERQALAFYNKDEGIRKDSSAGGLFTSLAKCVLNQNGVVFGAAFKNDMEVHHIIIENIEQISLLRGSKYVQSRINDSFKEVKNKLKEGRKVLFTGTPCQVTGLYNFLGERPENLYTCDIFCHGVPSPLVFKKYIQHLQYKRRTKIKNYRFRDKSEGWRTYSTKVIYENNKAQRSRFDENLYMKGFLRNLYLRNSCHNCAHKGDNLKGDISIGDFWGIEKKYPEIDDNKGIGAVIINTQQGKKLFSEIKDEIFTKEVSINDITEGNSALLKPAQRNENRIQFFHDINNLDITQNIKRYTKDKLSRTVKRKVKRTIEKMLRTFKLK